MTKMTFDECLIMYKNELEDRYPNEPKTIIKIYKIKPEAYLVEAGLISEILWKANLSKAILEKANLAGACLVEADLSEAYLNKANLMVADLTGANLRGANLSEADLCETKLNGANLEGMIIDDGEGREYVLVGNPKGDIKK